MIKTITKEEFLKEYPEYIIFRNYKEIPKILLDEIYATEDSYDVATPFKEGGKDWLFEYIYKYQPRTGEILKKSGDLFGGVDLDLESKYTEEGEIGNTYLGIECNNRQIKIERKFYGSNLCDTDEENKMFRETDRYHSLPYEIKMAYYFKFSGFGFSYGLGMGRELMANSWDSFDGYMESYRIPKRKHKEWYKWMEQYMPKFDLKSTGGVCIDFMSFMDTRYEGSKNKVDTTLFVKTHLKDGVIYAIQNGDISNMKVLSNPVEAIDKYCAYVLTTGETDFAFTPYLVEIARSEDKEEVIVSDEEPDFSIYEIRLAYVRGKYIGNNEKLIEWYKEIKWYLTDHDFRKNYIGIRNEEGWYEEDDMNYLSIAREERLLNDLRNGEKIKEIRVYSVVNRGNIEHSDVVVFGRIDIEEGVASFHVWDDYTEETDMEEKLKEMKSLIKPEIEEIFDWKCKNKFPYDYVRFGEKGLIKEGKKIEIYRKEYK